MGRVLGALHNAGTVVSLTNLHEDPADSRQEWSGGGIKIGIREVERGASVPDDWCSESPHEQPSKVDEAQHGSRRGCDCAVMASPAVCRPPYNLPAQRRLSGPFGEKARRSRTRVPVAASIAMARLRIRRAHSPHCQMTRTSSYSRLPAALCTRRVKMEQSSMTRKSRNDIEIP